MKELIRCYNQFKEVKETNLYGLKKCQMNLQINGNLTFPKVQGRGMPAEPPVTQLICMPLGKNRFAFLYIIYNL